MPRIGEIKIKDMDTSLSTKGGRVLEVKCGSHSFLTPTRPFSATEINAKSYLGYRGEIKSDIAAIAMDFSGKRKELFFKNNGVLKDSVKSLQSHSDASYNLPSMPIIQIDPFKAEDTSHFKLAFEVEKSIEGIDIMAMPGVIGSNSAFEKITRNWCDCSEYEGHGSAIQLLLTEDVDSFSERLKVLAEFSKSGMFHVLNIQYAPPSNVRQQLATLWGMREELNVIINCTKVTSPQTESTSGIVRDVEVTLLQNGFDMITKKKSSISSKYASFLANQPKITSLDEIDEYKIARHSASATIKSRLWNVMKHPPECKCSVCRGQTRKELIERFGYLDNGDISKSGLRYYSLLHDHQSDMQELDVFRKYTATDGTKEYDRRIDDNYSELQRMSESG